MTAAPRFSHRGLIGGMFFVVAIAVLGMPPLSGFIGKLLILDATTELSGWPWIWGLILSTSLLGLIGFASAGSVLFWKSDEVPGTAAGSPPIVLPMIAVGSLVAVLIGLTGMAGTVVDYLDATTEQLFETRQYVEAVLGPNARGDGDG